MAEIGTRPARAAPQRLRVVAIDPERDPRWGPWVLSRPDAVVYHHPAWVRVLQRAYGYESCCLACEDEHGDLQGVLPLMVTDGRLAPTRVVSLPHTPVAGPLADRPEVARELLATAIEAARERGARLQVKAVSPALAEDLDNLAVARGDDTWMLALPAHPEELRFGTSRNHGRLRWATRKATRAGVTVRDADADADLAAWYRLYLETMRWHAVPPRPYRAFRAMWDVLRPLGMLRLLLAERPSAGGAQTPIAGYVVLSSGATATCAYNGRRREELALRPNDLLQWTAIHELRAAGVCRYDFGEAAGDQQGLAEFKGKWGAKAVPLHRYRSPPGQRSEPTALAALAANGVVRRTAEAAWRRLPLPVTARVGDWLYRSL